MFKQNRIHIYRSDSRCSLELDLSVDHVSPILHGWNQIFMYVNPMLIGFLLFRIDLRVS
jgi:hypothetical protein